jgi:hypothetical protein
MSNELFGAGDEYPGVFAGYLRVVYLYVLNEDTGVKIDCEHIDPRFGHIYVATEIFQLKNTHLKLQGLTMDNIRAIKVRTREKIMRFTTEELNHLIETMDSNDEYYKWALSVTLYVVLCACLDENYPMIFECKPESA